MSDGSVDLKQDARERAWSMPIAEINVADPLLFQTDSMWPYFERLRKEAPVHYQTEHEFGPYWSVTRYNDIMEVDTNHQVFSSEGGITIAEPKDDFRLPMFIAMDPPKHDVQRKTSARSYRRTTCNISSRSSASGRRRSSTTCRWARRSTGSTRSPSS